MGVWMIGTGNISINPPVDDNLIKEYIKFSRCYYPEEYREEGFANTWFFDENNNLVSIPGKFAEPSIWYRHIKKNFFEPKGYELDGEMVILGECEPGFIETCKENCEKYRRWKINQATALVSI